MIKYKKQLNAPNLPEQLFADSHLRLTHEASGAVLEFNALDALQHWQSNPEETVDVADCIEIGKGYGRVMSRLTMPSRWNMNGKVLESCYCSARGVLFCTYLLDASPATRSPHPPLALQDIYNSI